MLRMEIDTKKKYPRIIIHTPLQLILFYRFLLFLVWFGVLFFSLLATIDYYADHFTEWDILKQYNIKTGMPQRSSIIDVIILWVIVLIFYWAIMNLSSSFVMIITRRKFLFGRKHGIFVIPIKSIPKQKLKAVKIKIEKAKAEQHIYFEVETEKSKILFFLFSYPGDNLPPELTKNLMEILDKLTIIIEKAKNNEPIDDIIEKLK